MAAASTQGTVESEAEDAAGLAASGNGAGFKMGNTFTGVRHVVRNCVSIRNPGASDMQHNSWDRGITFTAADVESLSDERFLAPRMPDGGLPDLDLPTLPRAGDALWASPASPGT